MYVVESGELDCFKREALVKTYVQSEAFGDLALLYNAPRAATITTKNECRLWALDRATFSYIAQEAMASSRQRYEEFLAQVPLLKQVSEQERSKIIECMKEKRCSPGEQIVS